MNKTEFIAAIAEEAGLSKTDAAKAVKAFTDVVVEEMKKGEKIQLVGFGTFEVSKRPNGPFCYTRRAKYTHTAFYACIRKAVCVYLATV